MEANTKPVKAAAVSVSAGSASADASVQTSCRSCRPDDGCAMSSGRMPACAPLAFPYIPMQENNPDRYSQQDAMRSGTLFPGLHLPFHKELDSRFPAANTALSELMALDFAVSELGLYLTTHPDDSEVLELYWSYIRLMREGREKYRQAYGPLLQTDITPQGYDWLKDPWPWDLGGNA